MKLSLSLFSSTAVLQSLLAGFSSSSLVLAQSDFQAFINDGELKQAVDLWMNNQSAAVRQFGNISDWDVSAVEDFSGLFLGMENFNENISMWNTSRATDMSRMFQQANFNGDISLWSVGKVTSFADMFRAATSFNSDISGWDTTSIRDMSTMFWEATSFNIDLSNWEVMNVRDFSGMFRDTTVRDTPGFTQSLCWQFRENVIVLAMFCGSDGSFDDDCVCDQSLYYDEKCIHPDLVPQTQCTLPDDESAAGVNMSSVLGIFLSAGISLISILV